MTSRLRRRRDGTKSTHSPWITLGGLVLALAAMPAAAQLPMPASTQFDMTGLIQVATLDSACATNAHCGGTVTVNGHVITIPKETIVIFPAAAYTWQEIFALSPAPYTGVASGLAQADVPAPLGTYEIHVVGNRVTSAPGGDQYIAGMVNISQSSLSTGAGFINFIDYTKGELRVGGLIGDSTTGTRVQINDPQGRFGRVMSPDVRFSVDDANPTIVAGTGFPMCLPRFDPATTPDPECPQSNRPPAVVGFSATVQMNDPVALPGVPPDATKQAPLEVGDFVTFSGTVMTDNATQPSVGPWPGAANTYVSAHTIVSNVAIYTFPGTNPAYVSIEVGLIGTGGLTVLGAGEAAIRTRFEGMSTDPSRNIHLYGVDLDPLTGATSDRDWGTIGVDPGPPNGAVKGRWRYRPPCTASVADQKSCTPPPAGTFLPPPREVRAVIEGLQSQNPQNALDPVTNTCGSPPCAVTTANGLFYGQYHAPIGEYIFPENIPGSPIVENNFNTIAFLAQGGYTSSAGTLVGQLNPWPSNVVPTPACLAPVANAGGPYTVASGGSVTLAGSSTGTAPVTLAWTASSGSFTDPTVAAAVYSAAGATSPVTVTLTASNACGTSSSTASITINAAGAPTVAHVAPISVFSGAPGSFSVSGTDPNTPAEALTFTVTQSGAPALLNLTVTPTSTSTANVTFTAPTLPIGQVTSSVVSLTITATNTGGTTSAAEFTTVTVNPIPDALAINNVEYRTGKQRLIITATSSVVSPNVIVTLQPYLTVNGTTFDPATLGADLTNTGGGIYTLTLVGAPEPAVPPATPLTVKSNLGGVSPPHGIDRLRQ